MKNYVQKGHTLTCTANRTCGSGSGMLISGTGVFFGVCVFDAVNLAEIELLTYGVFDLAKDTSTFADGDIVYWDNTNFVATSKHTSSEHRIGIAHLTQPSGTNALGGAGADATVRVKLDQFIT